MKIIKPKLQSLALQKDSVLYLTHNRENEVIYDDYWHFHEEYEIAYIPRGNGRRFIGNKTSFYEDGDLVLLSSEIPHNTYYYAYESSDYEEFVIQFKVEDVQQMCDSFPEFGNIGRLLDNCKEGLCFFGADKNRFGKVIEDIFEMNKYERLINFFNLLNAMSQSKLSYSLEAEFYFKTSKADSERLRKVYDLISKNYKDLMITRDIAIKFGLTESSFCRFFKKSTGKTFKQVLTEVRVNEACFLLANTEMQIGDVGLETGFSNVPLFNKMFKRVIQEKPSDYRKRFRNSDT